MTTKKGFTGNTKSRAMLVSLAVHCFLILFAITFVAVSVMPGEEPSFEVKKVTRPRMPPKKLKVPVDTKKRKPKPRLRKRILTERTTFTDIKMPEITGVAGGLGNMGGDGMGSLGFDLDMDLFGSNRAMGNELVGRFYDLKQNDQRESTGMTSDRYIKAVAEFASSWKLSRLEDYFMAPREKYASAFMIPLMKSEIAPEAFGLGDSVTPKYWVAYYTGHIAAPETGYYRFCGFGDDVLLVRVKNRLVLDASHPGMKGKITRWDSDDENNRKYPIVGQRLVIGDWLKLTKDKPVEIEILFGERPGVLFACQLLIEQKGKEYRQIPFAGGTRPVLPIFKTKDVPGKVVKAMKLDPSVATLEGPSFGAKNE